MEVKPVPQQDLQEQNPQQNQGAGRKRVWQVISPVALALFLAACSSGIETTPPELTTTATDSLRTQVRSSADDAEEASSGKMVTGSSAKVLDFSSDKQKVGLRFTGVEIPQDAEITKAYIRLLPASSDSGSTTLTIKAHDTDSASQFKAARKNISSRSLTSASVRWQPSSWRKGKVEQSSDLSAVVQEVVNRNGWDSGNALALIVSGDNKNERRAVSHNGGGNKVAPTLYVWYESDGSDEADEGGSRTAPSSSKGSCLNNVGDLVKLSGTYTKTVAITKHGRGVRVDARNAKFAPRANYPLVAVSNARSFCLSGGVVDVGLGTGASWDAYHEQRGMYFRNTVNPTVEGVAVLNAGDCITIKENVPNWTFRDSYGKFCGDDGIENDRFSSGMVDDVLIDHAYTGVSCRKEKTAVKHADFTIQNSLIALTPQRKTYGGGSNGHAYLFKWGSGSNTGCKLHLKNNVFLLTNGAGHIDIGDDPRVKDKPLNERACRGNKNTVVYLGGNRAYVAQLKQASPACFEVTTDKNVWNRARARWFDRHPEFSRYR